MRGYAEGRYKQTCGAAHALVASKGKKHVTCVLVSAHIGILSNNEMLLLKLRSEAITIITSFQSSAHLQFGYKSSDHGFNHSNNVACPRGLGGLIAEHLK
jgi:hypothetical protein